MQTYNINITLRREQPTPGTPEPRRKRQHRLSRSQRRTLRLASKLTLVFFASMAAARLIMLGLEFAGTRNGLLGGEAVIPAFIVALVALGWNLRGWVAEYKKIRKEIDNECTTESAQRADATSIRANNVTAFGMSRNA